MPNDQLFFTILYFWMALAVIVFFVLFKKTAPYGRHYRKSAKYSVPNSLGWMVMEMPAVLVFGWFFVRGSTATSFVSWLFFVLWELHYLNRSLIFPLRMKTNGKRMPVQIVVSAFCFNCINGYVNGHYLGAIAPDYPQRWFLNMRFLAGVALFFGGLAINWQADAILVNLRKRHEYRIPHGGLFEYLSCPNYFGEMLEWLGFALMTWALPAFSFFLWTAANLLPRALAHHKWYQVKFQDYPAERKAIIPFVL